MTGQQSSAHRTCWLAVGKHWACTLSIAFLALLHAGGRAPGLACTCIVTVVGEGLLLCVPMGNVSCVLSAGYGWST